MLYQGSLHGRRRYVTFKRALVWCSVDTISACDDAVPHSSPDGALANRLELA